MAKPTMGTVDKALSLLRHFSVQRPDIGLSELSRLAGHDKTTVLRCMNALERNGFVEQNVDTRKYRLGLAPINLARIRERSFPLMTILQPHLDQLAKATNETAHATVLTGKTLMTVLISEPERATRVHLDPSVNLPAHASATGLAIAAFLPENLQTAFIQHSAFERFTDHTTTDYQSLLEQIKQTRARGYSIVAQAYEDDVTGTATPLFGASGQPVGAIAVAAVSSRYDAALSDKIAAHLMSTATEITKELGGTRPPAST